MEGQVQHGIRRLLQILLKGKESYALYLADGHEVVKNFSFFP